MVFHPLGVHRSKDASILDASGRAAAFAALHPFLERLVYEAGTDARLSPQAPAALQELETHGYLLRLARLAPHLAAALPDRHPPGPDRSAASG